MIKKTVLVVLGTFLLATLVTSCSSTGEINSTIGPSEKNVAKCLDEKMAPEEFSAEDLRKLDTETCGDDLFLSDEDKETVRRMQRRML